MCVYIFIITVNVFYNCVTVYVIIIYNNNVNNYKHK